MAIRDHRRGPLPIRYQDPKRGGTHRRKSNPRYRGRSGAGDGRRLHGRISAVPLCATTHLVRASSQLLRHRSPITDAEIHTLLCHGCPPERPDHARPRRCVRRGLAPGALNHVRGLCRPHWQTPRRIMAALAGGNTAPTHPRIPRPALGDRNVRPAPRQLGHEVVSQAL